MADKNTPLVAFIGLGSMGLGMAKNLLKHGHKVTGVDPSAPAREAFAAAGGTVAATPAEAAASADVVVVAVVNAQQVETVLYRRRRRRSRAAQGRPRHAMRHRAADLRQVAWRAARQVGPRSARRADVGRPRPRRIGRAHLHGLRRRQGLRRRRDRSWPPPRPRCSGWAMRPASARW